MSLNSVQGETSLLTTIDYESEELYTRAQQLADKLHFKIVREANPCLFVAKERLALKIKNFSLLFPDFAAKTWNKRKHEGKAQGLVKACKPGVGIKIIDATAGWGRDAAVLASFGAEVFMLERHPVMAALLEDALKRAGAEGGRPLSLSLHAGDAYHFLESLTAADYPDVIYIDPMHPQRNKAALVKKDMQALQQIIGPDEDAQALIALAIKRTKKKVVVKWPQKTKALLPADIIIPGSTVRFDIYLAVNR